MAIPFGFQPVGAAIIADDLPADRVRSTVLAARWSAPVALSATHVGGPHPPSRRLSSDSERDSINTLRRSVSGILISCLVTAGSAFVIAVVIAIVDIYVSGHNLEPTHWPVIREWLFGGSLIVVFLTTLFVSLKMMSARS